VNVPDTPVEVAAVEVLALVAAVVEAVVAFFLVFFFLVDFLIVFVVVAVAELVETGVEVWLVVAVVAAEVVALVLEVVFVVVAEVVLGKVPNVNPEWPNCGGVMVITAPKPPSVPTPIKIALFIFSPFPSCFNSFSNQIFFFNHTE
jgi:hypothetical protein